MNSNPGIQNQAVVAWLPSTAYPRQINKHRNFGFVFEVITSDIATAAVFKVQSAPPSAADPCVPDATWTDVEAVPTCTGPVVPGTLAQFTFPVGTKVGSIASGTLPCVPDAFIRLASVSGETAKIRAILVLQGPMT